MPNKVKKAQADMMDANSEVRQERLRNAIAPTMSMESKASYKVRPVPGKKVKSAGEQAIAADTKANKKKLGVGDEDMDEAIDMVRKKKSASSNDYNR